MKEISNEQELRKAKKLNQINIKTETVTEAVKMYECKKIIIKMQKINVRK